MPSPIDAAAVPAPGGAAVFLRTASERFVATFSARCDAMDALAASGAEDAAAVADHLHRLAGLAGSVGFPLVGRHASEAHLLLTRRPDAAGWNRVRARLLLLREIFAREVSTIAPPPVPCEPESGTRLTLCVVDDDPDQRDLLKRQLEQAGHLVVALPSAERLLPTVRTLRPSAVLLDVLLPGLSGYGMCVKLKADPRLSGIPVLFLSARATPLDRLTGLGLGADDYLVKPVDVQELLVRVRLACLRAGRAAQ